MKKLVLVLAVMALVAVGCKKVEPSARLTTADSTAVQVDSVDVDSTTVDITAVK
jgi:PBP1b-binding outer membrane lipoprotein LpoB